MRELLERSVQEQKERGRRKSRKNIGSKEARKNTLVDTEQNRSGIRNDGPKERRAAEKGSPKCYSAEPNTKEDASHKFRIRNAAVPAIPRSCVDSFSLQGCGSQCSSSVVILSGLPRRTLLIFIRRHACAI